MNENKKIKVTVKYPNEEPITFEGDILLLDLVERQEDKTMKSSAIGYGGGTYDEYCRILIGLASYLHETALIKNPEEKENE